MTLRSTLYAIDRGIRWRAGVALAKGAIIFVFGFWILFEVGRRAIEGGTPAAETMGVVGLLALVANVACLGLLFRFRTQDMNMSSTYECSRNDVMANSGVIVAAVAVGVTGSAWPDLAVGLLIAVICLHSAWKVTRVAWPEYRRQPRPIQNSVLAARPGRLTDEMLDVLHCDIASRPAGPTSDDLAPYVLGTSLVDDQIVVRFAVEGSAVVRAFADAECVCCGGIGWKVNETPEWIALTLAGTPEQLAVLASAWLLTGVGR